MKDKAKFISNKLMCLAFYVCLLGPLEIAGCVPRLTPADREVLASPKPGITINQTQVVNTPSGNENYAATVGSSSTVLNREMMRLQSSGKLTNGGASAAQMAEAERILDRVHTRVQHALVRQRRGLRVRRAEQAQLRKDTNQVLWRLNQVLLHEPTNKTAWYEKAVAHYYLSDFSAAITAARTGLHHCPGDAKLIAVRNMAAKRL